MPDKKLTDKQSKFIDEYLVDLNATQAAIRAGYSEKTAALIGFENIRKLNIQEAIQKRRKKLQKSLHITQERVLQEEARLAFQDTADLYDESGNLLPVHEIPEDARRAIGGVEITENKEGETKYKYRMWDKGRSLERISKHLGLYAPEKKEITGKNGGPIETRITDFPKEPKTIKEWEDQRKEAEKSRNNESQAKEE